MTTANDCVEIVNEAAFRGLASAWNAGADAARSPSVFLRHEWFDAAWSWRRATAHLALFVLARDAAAASVLPLVRPHSDPRRLELLTVPDTQFADMVGPASDAGAASRSFAVALRDRGDWDVLDLDYLRKDSVVVRHLVPALENVGLRTHVVDRGANPYIEVALPWPDYFATRSRRLKKALNLAGNRLRKSGDIRIEHVTADTDDRSFRQAIDAVIAVSGASWKQRTGNSLDQPGPQAFIRTLSEAARRQGWLSVWLLRLDERPLAMEYQLLHGHAIHALRADFLAECEEISPGTHLFRSLLEQLCGRGHLRYYLGPGDNPYKARWSEAGVPLQRVTVYNRTARGRMLRIIEEFAKPVLRGVRDRWTAGRRGATAYGSAGADDEPLAAVPTSAAESGNRTGGKART